MASAGGTRTAERTAERAPATAEPTLASAPKASVEALGRKVSEGKRKKSS